IMKRSADREIGNTVHIKVGRRKTGAEFGSVLIAAPCINHGSISTAIDVNTPSVRASSIMFRCSNGKVRSSVVIDVFGVCHGKAEESIVFVTVQSKQDGLTSPAVDINTAAIRSPI